MHTLFPSHRERRAYQCYGGCFLLVLSTLLAACGATASQPVADTRGTACPSTTTLQGAGSTFDAPLFSTMFAAYAKVPCGLAVRAIAAQTHWASAR